MTDPTLPPGTIRIIGKYYTVTVDTINSDLVSNNQLGQARNAQCKLLLDSNQDQQQMRDTLLHEVIHAIDYSLNLRMKERQVHALAAGLLATLRENPDFVRWLLVDVGLASESQTSESQK